MKKLLTLAIVATGTAGFATASLAEGCNWGAKASLEMAEGDHTPVPETPAVDLTETTTDEGTLQTAQAPETSTTE